jgi:hypothetical protein
MSTRSPVAAGPTAARARREDVPDSNAEGAKRTLEKPGPATSAA